MNISSEKPQKTKTSPYEVNKRNKTRHDRKQLAINKKYSDSELVLRTISEWQGPCCVSFQSSTLTSNSLLIVLLWYLKWLISIKDQYRSYGNEVSMNKSCTKLNPKPEKITKQLKLWANSTVWSVTYLNHIPCFHKVRR